MRAGSFWTVADGMMTAGLSRWQRPITFGNMVVVSHSTGCSFRSRKSWELFPCLISYHLSPG
jgi:hypothetical protein